MDPSPKLVVIISYCSKERPYISSIVSNALKFADLVIVSMGTRLFNGDVEDVDFEWENYITRAASPVEKRLVATIYEVPDDRSDPNALHNLARQAGVATARDRMGHNISFWTLFLDGDEVPDGDKFQSWKSRHLSSLDVRSVYKLANYWAFLHPQLIASVHEDSVLLAHSSLLTRGALSHPRERDGIYLWHWTSGVEGSRPDIHLVRDVTDDETSSPMFWHFSWVRRFGSTRLTWPSLSSLLDGSESIKFDTEWSDWIEDTRIALKAKCAGWGHCGDREWNSAIDLCMHRIRTERRLPDRDFVHGHSLRLLPTIPVPLSAFFSMTE
jgi:hypothetical protein